MIVEAIEEYAALEKLAPEWSALADRSRSATPFQRPEWLLPWCRHLGPARPWAAAVRDGGRLDALVPLFLYDSDAGPTLAFLGAGVSDYLDALVEPERETASLAEILLYLARERARWNRWDLEELPPGSPLRHFALPNGWSEDARVQSTCPVLDVPRGSSDLSSSVPRRQLKKLAYYRRRAEREGGLEVLPAPPGEEPSVLEDLYRLHQARWSARGEPGMLAPDPVRAFHREVARGFSRRGELAAYRLRIGGRTAACFYGFFARGVLYFYLAGFDPRLSSLSPGLLMLGGVFELLIPRGLRAVDFLRGGERYKYSWGATPRTTFRRRLWREHAAADGRAERLVRRRPAGAGKLFSSQ